MTTTALSELYSELTAATGNDLNRLLPKGIQREVGHFNVFELAELWDPSRMVPGRSYLCRSFYKISLLHSRSRAEYVDRAFDMAPGTLVFSTPDLSFRWRPDEPPQGYYCVFTAEFLLPILGGRTPDELPLFTGSEYPVFQLTATEAREAGSIFTRLLEESASDYVHKYDLLRAYVLELLHLGQKQQPVSNLHPAHSAAARLSSRFVELLERQFPIATPEQSVRLRTAKDFAAYLNVHVNHLNKVLKDTTGRTTTSLISERLAEETKLLLRQTDWTLTEIADCLGFVDVAHLSRFFRRYASASPGAYRQLDDALL